MSHAILSEIKAFCREYDMADSTFGRKFMNDARFVRDLKFAMRQCREETMDRLREKMAEYRKTHNATNN